ncbi:hypothetical protein [Micropruina sp.]|uniref:hypothetical protein n=1 Tax=Micropruina sp. TaxID=2737536 RepID=UPI0039E25C1A
MRSGVVIACVCALAAGCSTTVLPTPVTESAGPAPTMTTTVTTRGYATARFGSTHTWGDGLSVKVGKPASFWPSGWVREVNAFRHFVVVTVTITNRTSSGADLSALTFDGRSGGKAADTVHDPGKVGPGAPVQLGKGKAVTFRVALGVPKPTDVQLQVKPDTQREPVVFRS